MEKQLLTTSATPRKYYKECLEKGIKRCAKCGTVKSLEEFGFSGGTRSKYKHSHCRLCVASTRRQYTKKIKAGEKGDLFRKKHKKSQISGRVNLVAGYVADNLTTSFFNYSNRMGVKADYASIHKCITPEMLIAKEASIKIQRLIKKLNHE
jgi:hypothetical protein